MLRGERKYDRHVNSWPVGHTHTHKHSQYYKKAKTIKINSYFKSFFLFPFLSRKNAVEAAVAATAVVCAFGLLLDLYIQSLSTRPPYHIRFIRRRKPNNNIYTHIYNLIAHSSPSLRFICCCCCYCCFPLTYFHLSVATQYTSQHDTHTHIHICIWLHSYLCKRTLRRMQTREKRSRRRSCGVFCCCSSSLLILSSDRNRRHQCERATTTTTTTKSNTIHTHICSKQ